MISSNFCSIAMNMVASRYQTYRHGTFTVSGFIEKHETGSERNNLLSRMHPLSPKRRGSRLCLFKQRIQPLQHQHGAVIIQTEGFRS